MVQSAEDRGIQNYKYVYTHITWIQSVTIMSDFSGKQLMLLDTWIFRSAIAPVATLLTQHYHNLVANTITTHAAERTASHEYIMLQYCHTMYKVMSHGITHREQFHKKIW